MTRKSRLERGEREVQATELRTRSGTEKRVRAIKKSLRAIERLVEAESQGKELDAQQRTKVDSLEGLLQELDALTAAQGTAASPDE